MKALPTKNRTPWRKRFPVYVHGMLKTESYLRLRMRPDDSQAKSPSPSRSTQCRSKRGWKSVTRRHWPARWSTPCPTWSIIRTAAPSKRSIASCRQSSRSDAAQMKLDLKEIQEKRTNLNAQEIGDDKSAAAQWKRFDAQSGVRSGGVVADGQGRRAAADRDAAFRRRLGLVQRLGRTKLAAHHGRRRARPANRQRERCALCRRGVLERGIDWLKKYQDRQVQLLKKPRDQPEPANRSAQRPPTTGCARLHGAGRCRREERRDARLPLSRPPDFGGLLPRPCSAWP